MPSPHRTGPVRTRPVRTARSLTALLVGASLLTSAAGCSPAAGPGAESSSGAPSAQVTLTVLAAASLKETFTQIGSDFEASHPGVTVRFSFAGSSDLASQVMAGSPADVFASAATKNMTGVAEAGKVDDPVDFARNSLTIAVPPGNPGKVTALSDLTSDAVKVALCQPAVPCGAAARTLLAGQQLTVRPATLEADVKSVLTKVQLDEVDAGLVYVTDVRAAGKAVEGIMIPADQNVWTTYPIARVRASANPELAQAFVDQVTGEAGQKVLESAGFAPA